LHCPMRRVSIIAAGEGESVVTGIFTVVGVELT
jgi:hypothetical protein